MHVNTHTDHTGPMHDIHDLEDLRALQAALGAHDVLITGPTPDAVRDAARAIARHAKATPAKKAARRAAAQSRRNNRKKR